MTGFAAGAPEAVHIDYVQTNDNVRALADVRFKLLALVPVLGGAAIYVLTLAGLANRQVGVSPTPDDLWLVLLLSVLGVTATIGIVFYDQRNSELYNALIHRAKHLEALLGLPRSPSTPPTSGDRGGQFQERPKKQRTLFGVSAFEMGHDKGLAMIYGPVTGAWVFPIAISSLQLAGAGPRIASRISAALVVVGIIVFTRELLSQDDADRRRWNAASRSSTAP